MAEFGISTQFENVAATLERWSDQLDWDLQGPAYVAPARQIVPIGYQPLDYFVIGPLELAGVFKQKTGKLVTPLPLFACSVAFLLDDFKTDARRFSVASLHFIYETEGEAKYQRRQWIADHKQAGGQVLVLPTNKAVLQLDNRGLDAVMATVQDGLRLTPIAA